jgi:hypothetical protein
MLILFERQRYSSRCKFDDQPACRLEEQEWTADFFNSAFGRFSHATHSSVHIAVRLPLCGRCSNVINARSATSERLNDGSYISRVRSSSISCEVVWIVVASVVANVTEVDQEVGLVDSVKLKVHTNLNTAIALALIDRTNLADLTHNNIVDLASRLNKE